MQRNGIIGHYYGGQSRRRRNRAKDTQKKLEETSAVVREVLTEASAVVGYWMIPNANGYAKLKINESYELGGKRYPLVSHGRPFPMWALLANQKLLAPYAPKVIKQIKANYDTLTDPQNIGTNDWAESAENAEDVAKAQGWIYFIEHGGKGWLGYFKDDLLATFGQEYFGGVLQRPVNVKLQGRAGSFMVDQGWSGWKSYTREKFIKLVGAADLGSGKKTYASLAELIDAVSKGEFSAATVDMPRMLELLTPPVVNQHFRTDPEGVAKLLVRWLKACKRINKTPPTPLRRYAREVQDAVNAMMGTNPPGASAGQQPTNEGLVTRGLLMESCSTSLLEGLLCERMSFAKLLANTKNYGRYKVGGMVQVNGRWTNDIMVPGRTDNARFVISAPPLTHIERDGSVVYRWKFKSRANRSTTGNVQLGYVRILPKTKGIMGFLKKLIKGDGPWEGDCEVWCGCPDFRYRSHYASWKAGASHKPTGHNGDSTLAPPVKTNPKMIPLLCKHLVFGGTVCLHSPPKKLKDMVAELQELAREQEAEVGGYEPLEPKESKPEPEPKPEELEAEPEPEPEAEAKPEEDDTGLEAANDKIGS